MSAQRGAGRFNVGHSEALVALRAHCCGVLVSFIQKWRRKLY